MQNFFSRAVSLFLPFSCVLCGEPHSEGLCRPCEQHYFSFNHTRCPQCANLMPLHTNDARQICGDCLKSPPDFDATFVVSDYAPPIDQLIISLKFSGNLSVARILAEQLSQSVLSQLNASAALPDLLIPVPLASKRLAERGFNQSLEIAKPFSRALNIPLSRHLICRTRETLAQSLLPLKNRDKNMRRAFSIPIPSDRRKIQHKHIGIIDDVMTSGATLHELSALLKRAGAARVTNFVIARSPQ